MTAQSSPRSGMARLLTEMLPCSDRHVRPVLEFVVDAVLRAVQDGHTGLALQDISTRRWGTTGLRLVWQPPFVRSWPMGMPRWYAEAT